MTRGSLADLIDAGSPELDWAARGKKLLSDAVRGLCYLHSMRPSAIVHHDVKPANILISEEYVAKLTDFGLSKKLNRTNTVQLRGTLCYCAPEILTNGKGNDRSDIYSFGVVVVTVLRKEDPQMGQKVEPPKGIVSGLNKLIKECLRKKQRDRPTAVAVLDRFDSLGN